MSENRKRLCILIFFGLIFSAISLVNHFTFKTYAWDLGIKNNELYDYAHFRWNHNTLIYPAPDNKLGNHFSLYLLIISPFYWVFGSWTLLLFQIIMILFGAQGVYLYFRRLFPRGSPLPLLSMIFFLSLWGIYSALGFDYHDNVVTAMFLPWLLLSFEKKKTGLFILFSVLMIIGKENIAIWLIFIAISLVLFSMKDGWKLRAGTGLGLFSILYLFIVMGWIIPWFAGDTGYRHFHYSPLGDDVQSAIKTIFTRPWYTFSLLWQDRHGNIEAMKTELHLVVLLSGGLFLLLEPRYLLMLIPVYAQKLFNAGSGRWGIDYHYSIEFVPILTFALFTALYHYKFLKYKMSIALISILAAASATIWKIETRAYPGHQRQNHAFYHPDHYKTRLNYFKVKKVLDLLPPNASVSAQNNLVPHLAFRDTIHLLPLHFRETSFIVLSDEHSSIFPAKKAEYYRKIHFFMNSGKYREFHREHGITIFRKTYRRDLNESFIFDTVQVSRPDNAKVNKEEFIGFGQYIFDRGDYFRAEIEFPEETGNIIFTARSVDRNSVYFDTRRIESSGGNYKMFIEGGPAFFKTRDTLNFYVWNPHKLPVNTNEFKLLKKKYLN